MVRAAVRHMVLYCDQAASNVASLRRAVLTLANSWRGGVSDEFCAEMHDLLRRIESHIDSLLDLAQRLECEVNEWEEVSRRGALALRGRVGNVLWPQSEPSFPLTGGGLPLVSIIAPLCTAFSVSSFLGSVPAWVERVLDRFFPLLPSRSSLPEAPQSPQVTSAFGELLKKYANSSTRRTESSRAEQVDVAPASTIPPGKYNVYYDVLPQSQGERYGRAACLPTAISMVLGYYHAQNPGWKTATPDEVLAMLDPGDGTYGEGVSFDRLSDDLAELGYQTSHKQGDLDSLSSSLQEGPVIVNVQVGLRTQPAREISITGNYDHAVLVKAMGADAVVVNDPWTGAEKAFSRQDFQRIWSKGGGWMFIVRPQENAR